MYDGAIDESEQLAEQLAKHYQCTKRFPDEARIGFSKLFAVIDAQLKPKRRTEYFSQRRTLQCPFEHLSDR